MKRYERSFHVHCSDCGKPGRIGLVVSHGEPGEEDGPPPTEDEWQMFFGLWVNEHGDPRCNSCVDGRIDPVRRN